MDATQTHQQYVGIDTGNALFTFKNNDPIDDRDKIWARH